MKGLAQLKTISIIVFQSLTKNNKPRLVLKRIGDCCNKIDRCAVSTFKGSKGKRAKPACHRLGV